MSNEVLLDVHTSDTITKASHFAKLPMEEETFELPCGMRITGNTNRGIRVGKQTVLNQEGEYCGVISLNIHGERDGMTSLCNVDGTITREAIYANGELISYFIVKNGMTYSYNKNEKYKYGIKDEKSVVSFNVNKEGNAHGEALFNNKKVTMKNGKIKRGGVCKCFLWTLFILLLLAALGFGGYYAWIYYNEHKPSEKPTAEIHFDAKLTAELPEYEKVADREFPIGGSKLEPHIKEADIARYLRDESSLANSLAEELAEEEPHN